MFPIEVVMVDEFSVKGKGRESTEAKGGRGGRKDTILISHEKSIMQKESSGQNTNLRKHLKCNCSRPQDHTYQKLIPPACQREERDQIDTFPGAERFGTPSAHPWEEASRWLNIAAL
jgi:hypothetical protein